MATLRVSVRVHSLLVTCALVSAVLMPISATAQALGDVKTPDTPLVLEAQGSFFVGGETVEQTPGQLGNLGPGGHITINQMYVRFGSAPSFCIGRAVRTLSREPPDFAIALWNEPRAIGDARRLRTETPPAEKPKTRTLSGCRRTRLCFA